MNSNRRFLAETLRTGLDLATVTADDVIKHVTPEVLAHHLPVSLKTKLLEASLAAEKMTPSLIVETLGPDNLAEHAPLPVLWACVAECARKLLGETEEREAPAASASSAGASVGASGASASAASASGAAAGGAAGDELKPNKTARPSAIRMPGRISSLSPRSRPPVAPPKNGTGKADVDEPSAFDQLETRAKSDGADFDIIDEESNPAITRRPVDEETRPGDLSGRKL